MSAISQGMKFKLGGFFKNLFSKSSDNAASAENVTPEADVMPETSFAPSPAPVSNTSNPNGPRQAITGIAIPLQPILAGFPLELRPKIRKQEVGELTVNVPFDKILSQLSTGVVKLSYGHIRRAAPQVFAPGVELDAVAVSLPLNEILSRLNPALLTRRPVQKRVEVPEEIESPFSGKGEGLSFGVGTTRPEAPAAPAPAVPRAQPAIPVAAQSQSTGTTTFRRISPKAMLPQQPAANAATASGLDAPVFQRKPAPAAPTSTPPPAIPMKSPPASTPDDAQIFQRKPVTPPPNVEPPAAAPAEIEVAAPIAFSPAAPPRPRDYFAKPPVQRSVQPAQPTPPTHNPAPAKEITTIAVPLAALAEGWPDAVRQEIVQGNLVDARLAMPAELVEAALKRGRVVFPWKTIRSWVRPPTGSSVTPSANDSKELELPLNVIAPMFLARQKAAAKQQKPEIDETIPNLFFGLPRPEPSATPKPADTNYYVWGDTNDSARVDDTEVKKRGGTDFVSRYATPNEIVSRAAALEGVAGVLIALPDGLMVASQIPPEFNGDTLAAFLPQIFSKVTQCTKELRMGELNNLNFTVGNVPWKIFRVNAIFFAVFGRAGEPLPSAELAGLAGELDRKRTA